MNVKIFTNISKSAELMFKMGGVGDLVNVTNLWFYTRAHTHTHRWQLHSQCQTLRSKVAVFERVEMSGGGKTGQAGSKTPRQQLAGVREIGGNISGGESLDRKRAVRDAATETEGARDVGGGIDLATYSRVIEENARLSKQLADAQVRRHTPACKRAGTPPRILPVSAHAHTRVSCL
jgi:hypothetical protein